jgi:hypothetical protein
MVGEAGIEPATSSVSERRSRPLSYSPVGAPGSIRTRRSHQCLRLARLPGSATGAPCSWRRAVDSNHTPSGGANRLATGDGALAALLSTISGGAAPLRRSRRTRFARAPPLTASPMAGPLGIEPSRRVLETHLPSMGGPPVTDRSFPFAFRTCQPDRRAVRSTNCQDQPVAGGVQGGNRTRLSGFADRPPLQRTWTYSFNS